jgi:hypothetical protein
VVEAGFLVEKAHRLDRLWAADHGRGGGAVKLIIAGSRDWDLTPEEIDAQFDDLLFVKADVEEVVSGGARGADDGGEAWAAINGVAVKRFPARWNKEGRAAGIRRNQLMAKYADAAIVFWRGQSSGSANMIANMVARDKPVRVVCPDVNHSSKNSP